MLHPFFREKTAASQQGTSFMDLQLRRLKEASLELKLFSFWQMIVLKKCKISFSFLMLAKTVPAVLWSASQPYDLLVVGSFTGTT